MKKIIKSILALTCTVTLLFSPFLNTATAYAATIVDVIHNDNYTYVEYSQSNPLIIESGEIGVLPYFTNSGLWNIKAGQTINVAVNFMQTTNVKYSIINTSTGEIVDSHTFNNVDAFSMQSPYFSKDGNYIISLTPTSTSFLLI
ncbi:hypothetical protein, partial [Anaerosporobacter sp.]|uniref:hypothetical protein n=1 Tax=Anaerosporobacter sp. TaxID=1872529 RepID=UPI00289B1C52